MPKSSSIKPNHKAITEYYASLQSIADQNVSHEMAVRRAFRELLATTAKLHDWTLIEELSAKSSTAGAGNVRPDATLRDKNSLPRGYWEAKDSADSLPKEIAKKKAKGYSLVNTIFEDTQTAILYQNGKQAFSADLSDPQAIADLLNQFYAHTEPDIAHFEEAVNDFKDRVPDLARGLVTTIETAHKKNPKFQKAFADFFTLCQTALNPNIAQAAVDEMLIQHILTERLFRTIFNAADFTQRNVIAAEVEKVITALSSTSFSREEYLKSLDRFYLAIENAARLLDWSEKQHFLNVVYERFFQGYSTKTADTMGIVYTPQPIVDFMCASVAEVLKTEFKKELGDPDVFILDPCTGTGNFIVNLLKLIPPKKLTHAYANNLFANEIMLLPYYIAALNIEHAHYELTGSYEPFEGLCFVDTLDLAESQQAGFSFMTAANTARVQKQKKSPITVVIGNPPYNTHQQSENDKNKNRGYELIDSRIRSTYAKDSMATNKVALKDPYVKFFRWASDRLQGRDGIVCLITNNSFTDQLAFDGMRRNLQKDFAHIYHLDLQGNVRHDPKLAGTTYNVFGIQLGVGITLAIKRAGRSAKTVEYHALDKQLRRDEKLAVVATFGKASGVPWALLKPDSKWNWLTFATTDEFQSFLPLGNKAAKASDSGNPETIFKCYSGGIKSNRDDVVYDFDSKQLNDRMRDFVESYNAEVDRYKRANNPEDIDAFIDTEKIKWDSTLKLHLSSHHYGRFSADHIRSALYRPFSKRNLYFDRLFINSVHLLRMCFPMADSNNTAIYATDVGSEKPFMAITAAEVADMHVVGGGASAECFPFYIYDEDGSNRRENITDWSLTQFRSHYNDKKITKWDIFYYVYGLLHHPAYRTKFADNLKRELPRIPYAPDFRAFATAGKKLADLHLNYESAPEYPLQEIITAGERRSPLVADKMRLSKDKCSLIVNPSLTLHGIPPETFTYRLGNRSALDWIIDQYQLSTDKRTNITSDPNRADDPEYILRLVAQVITVSLETMKIVNALPAEFT